MQGNWPIAYIIHAISGWYKGVNTLMKVKVALKRTRKKKHILTTIIKVYV